MQAANNLKEIRHQRRLAIQGLAAQAHCSPSLITAIERWEYCPRQETQSRLANALGVPVLAIWTGKSPNVG